MCNTLVNVIDTIFIQLYIYIYAFRLAFYYYKIMICNAHKPLPYGKEFNDKRVTKA